ncbi:MAG TPA: hypothetical protein VLE74_04010 [Candidatus Saccharimonadales bacterium]|nr:hypothetical protein [Candidatus Saccharimonadales bacterium]
MIDPEVNPEPKPQLEQALNSTIPTANCPLVVVDAGHSHQTTFVVLHDSAETFDHQYETAMPNFRSPIKLARKLLELERDPECTEELMGKIGRSEGRVAIAVPGTQNMSNLLLGKLGTVRFSQG